MTAPAAWYPDPGNGYQLRYFDGQAWTEHVHPGPYVQPGAYGTPPPARNRTVEALLPVNRTGLSIAAGYLGLMCLVVVPGPIAVLVSVLALRELRRKPDVAGRGRAWFGLVAGILATVGLLALIAHGIGNSA